MNISPPTSIVAILLASLGSVALWICVSLVIFLLLRALWLWYWRINDIADSLQSIAWSLSKLLTTAHGHQSKPAEEVGTDNENKSQNDTAITKEIPLSSLKKQTELEDEKPFSFKQIIILVVAGIIVFVVWILIANSRAG
jgi:hypothetical protein